MPSRKWDLDSVKAKMSEIAKEIGRFPTQMELRNMGYGRLVNVLYENNIKLREVAIELGYSPGKHAPGHWKKFENIKKAIHPIIEQNNGHFPTQDMIIFNGGKSLFNAIYEYHGGMKAVSKKMGYKLRSFHITSDGHYVNSANEYLLDEYLSSRGIEHEVNDLISENTQHTFDFKVDDYYIEIWGYEKDRTNSKIVCRYNEKRKEKEGLYKDLNLKLISIDSDVFRKRLDEIESYFDELFAGLGYDVSKKDVKFDIKNVAKHCYFWNEQRIIREVNEEIERNDWKDFPTLTQLKEIGRGDLGDAIKRFGGYQIFREKMGYNQHHKPDGYWNDEVIIEEIKKEIEEFNKFPTNTSLEDRKRHDLIRAIIKHGGFAKFQKLMGFKGLEKDWSRERCLSLLREVAKTLGKKPTYSECRKIDSKLVSAIDRKKYGFNKLVGEL